MHDMEKWSKIFPSFSTPTLLLSNVQIALHIFSLFRKDLIIVTRQKDIYTHIYTSEIFHFKAFKPVICYASTWILLIAEEGTGPFMKRSWGEAVNPNKFLERLLVNVNLVVMVMVLISEYKENKRNLNEEDSVN